MALQMAAVANSIAALSVSGVTLKDVDEIPEDVTGLGPIIMPSPAFVTNFTVDPQSFGGGSTAMMDVFYNFNYRLLVFPTGSGRGYLGVYDVLVDKLALFLDAVLAIDTFTGGVGISVDGISNFGVIPDPADNNYFGVEITLRIQEFVND